MGRRGLLAFLVLAAGCGDISLQKPVVALEVSDRTVDYGVVALGSDSAHALTFRNAGRSEITVSGLSAEAPFAAEGIGPDGLTLAEGEEKTIVLHFAPLAEGTFRASLAFSADDGQGDRAVPLFGRAVRAYVSLQPTELDFGRVPVGTSEVLSLTATNTTELPARARIDFAGVDASAFSSVYGGREFTVSPGEVFDLPVAFHPEHLGGNEAVARVQLCPDCPSVNVPLRGQGIASCFALNPSTVEFGAVDVGQTAEQTLTVENLSDDVVDVNGLSFSAATPGDFTLANVGPNDVLTLSPRAKLEVMVRFTPSAAGARAGAVKARSANGCYAEARLAGTGGKGCLEVAPAAVDFGTVALGLNARRKVSVANTACGKDVVLTGLTLNGDVEFGASTQTPLTIKQGQVVDLDLTFSPSRAGLYNAVLALEAADGSGTPLAAAASNVGLRGAGKELQPCEFVALPGRLDFGNLGAGQQASLALTVKNVGQDACYFTGIGLASGTSPAFRLGASTEQSFTLEKDAQKDLEVVFNPAAAGTFFGALEAYVSDPASPYQSFPLSGSAGPGCLSIQPREVGFGQLFVGCATGVRDVVVSNTCQSTATVQSILKGAGNSTEFSIQQQPALPLTLSPGESFVLRVGYTPTDDGLDTLPVYVDDGQAKQLVALTGSGKLLRERTDTFQQPDKPKVDVLLVVDNTSSMADKQAALAKNFSALMDKAKSLGVDYQLGVTTTGVSPAGASWTTCPGGADGGEAGRLFPADGARDRVMTDKTLDAEGVFKANVQVGTCHWEQKGLEATYRALTAPLVDSADDVSTPLANDGNGGFLRDGAKLAIVYVSDDEDTSPQKPDYYLTFLRSLKSNPRDLLVNAIVPRAGDTCGGAPGERMASLATATGGVVASICTPDWGGTLLDIGARVFQLSGVFQLSVTPSNSAGVKVFVNGAAVTAGWAYLAAGNLVKFDDDHVPPAGATVDVTYPIDCPN